MCELRDMPMPSVQQDKRYQRDLKEDMHIAIDEAILFLDLIDTLHPKAKMVAMNFLRETNYNY